MSLIDRISSLFRQRTKAAEPTTADEHAARPALTDALNDFQAARGRAAKMAACREMYDTDMRVKRILTTLGRDAVKGGFTLKVKNNARAQAVADDLFKRIDLLNHLDDWSKLTFRDGDTFLEASVNARDEITRLTRKPTLEMRRNSNDFDEFDDPTRAFWQAHTMLMATRPPEDAIWFAQWQIIHARWDHDEESRYGQPLFASATKAFKRFTLGEDDIAIRRRTRAGVKRIHQFPPGTDQNVIDAYKETNQDAIDDPLAAVADFFGTVDIKVVQGDAQLSEINDVVHHIRSFWTASPAPMGLIGYGNDLNRDVLDPQLEQYRGELEPITKWVTDEFVIPVLHLQWLLAGILPESIEYELIWQDKRPLSAEDLKNAADAALRLRSMGFDDDVIMAVLSKFLPGVDWSAVQMKPADDTQRVADAAAAL